MPELESTAERHTAPAHGRRTSRAHRFPTRMSLIQAALLIALALGSALLLQRWDSIEQSRHIAQRAKAQVDLIAHAAQPPSTSLEEGSRLLRILESSVRGGNVLAGAVLDSSGTVVAHTSLLQTGRRFQMRALLRAAHGSVAPELPASLFNEVSGDFVVRPLLSSEGEIGAVALMLPQNKPSYTARRLLPYLLPAGLVLLAFLGVSQSTIRSALKPPLESFDRLASAVEWTGDARPELATSETRYDEVVHEAVSRIQALTQSNDEMMLTNRLYKFENNRMKMILDHFPDGLIVMDVLNKTTFMNSKAARILGLGTDTENAWGPQEPPVEVLRTIREVDKGVQVLIPFGAEGAERQVLCSRIPLTASGGKTVGTLYAMRDVTAQNSAAKAQAEFLSQISHELKAPLNTVLAYADMLSGSGELQREERKEFYNIVTSEAHRMGQLIGNLLQLSRIQLGNLSAQFSLIKPGTLIKDQVESVRIQAEDTGVTLALDVPDNLASIRGDKDLLGVLLTNLISNALKYTPEGGKISVRAREEDGGVVLEVKDTGIGIPDEVLPHIYDKFYRSDQELVQQKPGSGLGLALVKEIVELHKGRITVESSAKSGTRFAIWFPALEIGDKLNPVEALT